MLYLLAGAGMRRLTAVVEVLVMFSLPSLDCCFQDKEASLSNKSVFLLFKVLMVYFGGMSLTPLLAAMEIDIHYLTNMTNKTRPFMNATTETRSRVRHHSQHPPPNHFQMEKSTTTSSSPNGAPGIQARLCAQSYASPPL